MDVTGIKPQQRPELTKTKKVKRAGFSFEQMITPQLINKIAQFLNNHSGGKASVSTQLKSADTNQVRETIIGLL